MKQILLLLFICVSGGLVAQSLAITPNSIDHTASPSTADVQMDFDVHNTDMDNPIEFLWRVANKDDIPEPWVAYICDSNLCYGPGVYDCPSGNPNSFDPDQVSTFNFHVRPNAAERDFTFVLELFDVDDPNNVYSSIEISLNTITTSTDDEEISDKLAVYPNPTSDVFKIKNDSEIASLAIYNIVGKQIEKFEHTAGKEYNITKLRKGVYLVRLFDAQGNAVKALRLSKK